MTEDIVEHPDLVFAQALPVMQEKIGDLSKGADPFRRRTASDSFFEFGNDGNGLLHNLPMPSLARQMRKVLKISNSAL
jgi:hypothetical protein